MAVSSQSDNLFVDVESVSAASVFRRSDESRDVVCCLRIPNRLLQEWHTQFDSSSDLIELLNEAVRGRIVTIDTNCVRIKGHLYRRAGVVARKASQTKPFRARQCYLDKSTIFDVFRGETVDAAAVMQEFEDTVLDDGEDIAEWTKRCEGYKETISLLRDQLRAVSHETSFLNIGLPINQVADRQRRRKLFQLKTGTEKALWFVNSFGLDVESITMRDSSGSSVVLNYACPEPSQPPLSGVLSEDTIAQTLYLLERFGVSDEFYHELSMLYPTLARGYKVKRLRKSMSKDIEIHQLPTPYHGAYRSFEACLLKVLTDEIGESPEEGTEVAVKISGDGAHFSKTSQFFLISFSLPFVSTNSLSGYGNHTVAAAKVDEDFAKLKGSFQPVLGSINELKRVGTLQVGGVDVKLKFYLGGDYKFLLMSMGLKAANSLYLCLWCTVHRDQKYDMAVTLEEAKKWKRTLSGIKECLKKPKDKSLGCIHEPLFDIELDCIVVDELHLLLRITDKLITSLVNRMAQLDNRSRLFKEGQPDNMTRLVSAINSCGVTFRVWNKPDASGRPNKDVFDWTSINGNERLLILQRLPPVIPSLVGGNASEKFRQIFEDFLEVYRAVSSRNPIFSKQELHQKFQTTTNRSEQVQLLTVLPKSWSRKKIQSEFGVTDYIMAKRSKQLVQEKGILSTPDPKPGPSLPANTVKIVAEFYECDEISRMMPGKKDFVSFRKGGTRIHIQKRLILSNLKEVYRAFKDANPDLKIGFSKFAELRPPQCVLAGASGTHSVCVCTIHQNVKLMFLGAHISEMVAPESISLPSYHHCLARIMCNPPLPTCHLGDCAYCPGVSSLRGDLLTLVDENLIDIQTVGVS